MKRRIFTLIFLLTVTNIYSQDFWLQTNGPYGGSILTITGKSTGELFCGTPYAGGVFRSTDNGNTWVKSLYAYAFDGAVKSIAVGNNGNVYSSLYGVIKTTNNGSVWIQIASFLSPNSIAVTLSGIVFAGGNDGKLYKTSNDGVNWVICLSAINPIRNVVAASNGNIYISENYVRMSTDNGATWSIRSTSAILPAVDMAYDSSGSLLLCNATGIFKTTNNGANWNNIYSGIPASAIGVAQGNIYYAGVSGGKIIKSTDNGSSWTDVYVPSILDAPLIVELYIIQSNTVFAATASGMLRTTNAGSTWERTNTGITNSHVTSICFDGVSKIFAGVSSDGVFMTSNRGTNWVRSGLEFKNVNSIGLNGPNNLFACISDTAYSTYRSTDGGLSWALANNGLENAGLVFKYKSVNGNVYASCDFGLFRSVNNGDSWAPSLTPGGPIKYFDANSSNEIFAGSGNVIYKSTDYGDNWNVLVTPGYTIDDFGILQINGYMFYLHYNGLYRSTNDGSSWSPLNSAPILSRLFFGPKNAMYGYGHDSLFKSTDFGDTWFRNNTGLLITDGVVLAFDQDDYGYAGTYGASVFKTFRSVISVQNISNSVPARFSLYQNYPNPFNPTTKIKFDIPKTSKVNVVVYDLLGRKVAVLVNEQLNPGTFEVRWDASNCPSGMYFYKITSGDYTDSRKMVLIK